MSGGIYPDLRSAMQGSPAALLAAASVRGGGRPATLNSPGGGGDGGAPPLPAELGGSLTGKVEISDAEEIAFAFDDHARAMKMDLLSRVSEVGDKGRRGEGGRAGPAAASSLAAGGSWGRHAAMGSSLGPSTGSFV